MTNKEDPLPGPTEPPNPEEVIPAPDDADEEQEDTLVPPPIPPAQYRVVPYPVPPSPYRVALPLVPPAPPNLVEDLIFSTKHEYNWYAYKNLDDLPINRRLREKRWGICLPTGDFLDDSGEISND